MATQESAAPLQPDFIIMGKKALLGAGIAYILITVFLLVPGITPDPVWPRYWAVRPLVIVPLAGALGGAFYHVLGRISGQGGWKKIMVRSAGLLIYIISLWLGTVLGLDGTLWN